MSDPGELVSGKAWCEGCTLQLRDGDRFEHEPTCHLGWDERATQAAELDLMRVQLRLPLQKAHSGRRTYLYSVEVEYPPGSWAEGWRPEGWAPDPVYDGYEEEFRWPRLRVYISKGAAEKLAKRLRKYGAIVDVVRSNPVEWP